MTVNLSFSSDELDTLKDFYDSLDGDSWQWLPDTDGYGIPWNVNNASSDPCAERWQGIHCTCLVAGTDAVLFPYTEHDLQYSYTDYIETYSITGDAAVTADTPCFVRQLNLVQYGLEGTVPDSLANLQYLQALQLSSNRISGTIDPFLWNLSHLESFVVGENAFTGPIPAFLDVATKNLTYLALANNELEGTFPASLCNLDKLTMLTLGASSTITGTLPSCIGALRQLDTFSLISTSMEGEVPAEICDWERIRDFSIAHNAFTSFPDCFGQSGSLEHINIGSNNGFDGSLSDSWCKNTGLATFQAAGNKFTGHIPSCFGQRVMSSLIYFKVSENVLSGTVADDLWNISTLVVHSNSLIGTIPDIASLQIQYVDFQYNYFTGTIPASLCQWSNLTTVIARSNLFTGPLLPSECSDHSSEQQVLSLMTIFFFGQNYLVGSLPREIICSWHVINFFDVSFNYLSGTLPDCIGDMANPVMNWMSFGTNSFHGTIPDAICNCSMVTHWNFQENAFTGNLPSCIGNLTNSYAVYVDTNQLNGTLPASFCELKNVHYLSMYGNQFSGRVPQCISEWKELVYIYFQRNQFTGVIEPFWCDLLHLQYFDARVNLLHGTLPLCLWDLKELTLLEVSENKFTGPLFFPDAFCNNASAHSLPYLQYFAVELNDFTGTIPSCIHQITPNVQVFDVSVAKFNGTVPDGFCLLNDLQILNLYTNSFSGTFPDCWTSRQSQLQQLNLWENSLIGTLPQSFCNLESLQSLQVAYNRFSGSLPACSESQWQSMLIMNASTNHLTGSLSDSFCGTSKRLQYLALNNNDLDGTIPTCFGSFDQLQFLFLSDNKLTGPLAFLRHGDGAPQLFELLIDNNRLTGPIFEDLANRSSSYITVNRSQLSVLLAKHNKFTGSLPTSSWQERYNLSLTDVYGALTIVDVSENHLTGQVEPVFFQAASLLENLLLIKNCFSGELSEDICLYSNNLQVLALDGLSAGCERKNALGISETATEAVHGRIPACLFGLPRLQTFHAAGNSFVGTLSSTIGENLTDLSLSHNNLCGTISVSIQRKAWTNLDLAYNKLEGYLVEGDDTTQWSVGGRAVKLNRNRLSGSIPTQYQSARDVNMLDGNLFACKQLQPKHRQELPHNDPNFGNYSCGTGSLNLMLFLGLGLACLSLLVLWLWASNACVRCRDTTAGSQTALSKNLPQGINAYGNCDEIAVWMPQEEEAVLSSTLGQYSSQASVSHEHHASKEDEESSSPSEIRGEERVLEHKADDPAHPANRIMNSIVRDNRGELSNSSSTSFSKFTELELAILQVKRRSLGCVQVLQSDLQSFRTQQSVFCATGNVRPTERLTRFLQVCDHQRRLFLAVGTLSLCVLLPLYLVLSFYYKTHSLSYAWIISSAYDGGAIPAMVLLSLWFVLFVWLYRAVDPELRYRGQGAAMRKILQRLYQVRAFWQEYSLIAVALLVNAVLILAINGIYVYLVVRNGRVVSIALQIVLATFKLLYNGRFESKLIRGSEWLQRLRKRQALLRRGIPASAFSNVEHNSILDRSSRSGGESLLAEDESYGGDDGLIPGIYSEAVLVVFNFVVAPIIAASLADTNCFYSAIVSPPPLHTSLEITFATPFTSYVNVNAIIDGVNVFTLDTVKSQSNLNTDFMPPFTYSGQCVSSIIATYVPVFVLLYLANLFVLPVIMFLRRLYFKRGLRTEQQLAESNDNEQSNVTVTELMTGAPKKAKILRSLSFDRRTFVVSRVTNLSVLLAFGWVFPPLAVLIALVEVRDSLYLVAALQQYIFDVGGMIQAEKKLGWHMTGIPASLPYLQLRFIPLGALFLSLLLYDMATDEPGVVVGSDQIGFIAALWAPLLMFLGPWLVDQLTLVAWLVYLKRSSKQKIQGSIGGIYIAHSTHDEDVEEAEDAHSRE